MLYDTQLIDLTASMITLYNPHIRHFDLKKHIGHPRSKECERGRGVSNAGSPSAIVIFSIWLAEKCDKQRACYSIHIRWC
jgi:hypothetical protein